MFEKKICFIVPAFNEEKTILDIVIKLKKYGHVIVINDSSTDRTKEIINKLDVIPVHHMTNLGYDLSLNSGFNKAKELKMDFAITFDADGQHDVNDAKKIIQFLLKGSSVVSGKRKYLPRISEKFFSYYTRKFHNITDALCGLKGYNIKDCIDIGILDKDNKIGTKILLNCKRKNLNFTEIEIGDRRRTDVSRYGNILKANIKIFWTLLETILNDLLKCLKIIK